MEVLEAQVERARHPTGASFLSLDQIDPSPEARNSRRRYDESAINELAMSIQEHGVLQPILVSPKDDGRYDTIFGNRRLLAAHRAQLTVIPAMVRPNLSERQKFVWNLVENIQRVDLSPKERVASILALADSGMGVREISRGTGKAPGTISRWLRVANKPAVVKALEEERIGLSHAQYLAPIDDPGRIDELLAEASSLTPHEFARRAQSVVSNNTYCVDDGRLVDIEGKLAKVRTVTPIGAQVLDRIINRALELRSQATTDAVAGRSRDDKERPSVRQRRRA
jgi:ParB family chromosome partitioning protein